MNFLNLSVILKVDSRFFKTIIIFFVIVLLILKFYCQLADRGHRNFMYSCKSYYIKLYLIERYMSHNHCNA